MNCCNKPIYTFCIVRLNLRPIFVISRRIVLVFVVEVDTISTKDDFDGKFNVVFDTCPRG